MPPFLSGRNRIRLRINGVQNRRGNCGLASVSRVSDKSRKSPFLCSASARDISAMLRMFLFVFLFAKYVSATLDDDYDILESVVKRVAARDLPALACVNTRCREMVIALEERKTLQWLQKVSEDKREAAAMVTKDFLDSLLLYPQLYGHFIRAQKLRHLLDFLPPPIIDGDHFLTSRHAFNRDGTAIKKRLDIYRTDLKEDSGTYVFDRIERLRALGTTFAKECNFFIGWFPRSLENPRAYMNLRFKYPALYEVYRSESQDFHKLC